MIEARVIERRGVAPGLGWKTIGAAASGGREGSLENVPAGRPYRIEFRARSDSGAVTGTVSVDGILVGDLWVLAGQSNMHGRGELAGAEEPDERVDNFDLADRWTVAREPVGDSLQAIDPAHWGARDAQDRPRPYIPEEVAAATKERTQGASAAMTFAKEMVARTDVPVGLIPCVRGATSLEKWSPARKVEGPASLFGAMLRRCAAAGGRVRGVLWYQGESDAIEKNSAGYEPGSCDLVRALRGDLRQPGLPVYYVQIGRVVAPDSAEWNNVQLAQLDAETQLARVAMVPAVDLELVDEIHIDVASLKRLGRRLANLACADLYPARSDGVKKGPRPTAARIGGPASDQITVTFCGVNGRLLAAGRLSGFSLRDVRGVDLLAANDAVLDPERRDTVVLRIKPHALTASGATLWYGWGSNPYCNLRDERDMAVPVFALQVRPD